MGCRSGQRRSRTAFGCLVGESEFPHRDVRLDVQRYKCGQRTHWIGWDPAAKKIRSWIFDADGGFGEGAWSKDGKKWIIKTHSILRDGKKATATYTIAPGDGDTMTLHATERTVDGNALPDNKEIKLKRVK